MPSFDSILMKNRGVRKNLCLVLDEDDIIIDCIKQGMKEHRIEEARIDGMEGIIKDGVISFMQGSHYKSKNLVNQEILRASGNYKLSFDELFGSINVTLSGRPPLTATLVKGRAAQGLKLTLSFVEIQEDKQQPAQEI